MQDKREVPPLSLILGYGPMLPLPAAAILVWVVEPAWAALVLRLAVLWAAAILLFLAGVRRGLSFRTPHGPHPAEIATMLWLFVLGLGALLSPWPVVTLGLLLLGYLSIAILDPLAARQGETPAFFARLRPFQMPIAIIGLAVLIVRLFLHLH